jgi:hypothetical protein
VVTNAIPAPYITHREAREPLFARLGCLPFVGAFFAGASFAEALSVCAFESADSTVADAVLREPGR